MNVSRDIMYEGPTHGLPHELISDLQTAGCQVNTTSRQFTAGPSFGAILTASGDLEEILTGVGSFKERGLQGTEVAVLDPYFVCGVYSEDEIGSAKGIYHAVDHQPGRPVLSLCEGLPVAVVARRFGLYYSKNCNECEAEVKRR